MKYEKVPAVGLGIRSYIIVKCLILLGFIASFYFENLPGGR